MSRTPPPRVAPAGPRGQILSERTVEKNVVVPSCLTRSESRLARENGDTIGDTSVRVREHIVEVAKPVAQEKIVEVNEVEFFETNVEFAATGYQEKIKEVVRVELEEEVVEVPKIIEVEKIVEVPEIEYQEIPVEKIVEVVEYEDQEIIKEVPVDEYVEVLVHQDKLVEVEKTFERNLPLPVEVISEWQFKMPVLQPLRRIVPLEVRVPRFIEVPVPTAYLSASEVAEVNEIQQLLNKIVSGTNVSLADLEKLSSMAAERVDLVRTADSPATSEEIKNKLTAHLSGMGPQKPTTQGVRYMASLLTLPSNL